MERFRPVAEGWAVGWGGGGEGGGRGGGIREPPFKKMVKPPICS